MFFSAKVNKTNYEITVDENRTHWLLTLQKEDGELKRITLPKTDYRVQDDGLISLIYENASYLLDVTPQGLDYTVYTRGSHRVVAIIDDERILKDSLMGGRGLGGQENLKAGMPGKIVKVFVEPDQRVQAGEPLLIMEAMKMENEMKAAEDAVIDRIHIETGASVESGALLISFKPVDS